MIESDEQNTRKKVTASVQKPRGRMNLNLDDSGDMFEQMSRFKKELALKMDRFKQKVESAHDTGGTQWLSVRFVSGVCKQHCRQQAISRLTYPAYIPFAQSPALMDAMNKPSLRNGEDQTSDELIQMEFANAIGMDLSSITRGPTQEEVSAGSSPSTSRSLRNFGSSNSSESAKSMERQRAKSRTLQKKESAKDVKAVIKLVVKERERARRASKQ